MAIGTRPTVEDVLRLGARGERYELIDGVLVPMSPTGLEHGDIELFAGGIFNAFILPHKLGKVFVGEVLFRLDSQEKLARAPDIAFIRLERLRAQGDLAGAFNGAPDLAVEIVSPSDSAKDVQGKVETWLAHGALAVLVMYPDRRVVLWRGNFAISLGPDDILDLDPVLPGFQAKVRDLYPPTLDELEGTSAV